MYVCMYRPLFCYFVCIFAYILACERGCLIRGGMWGCCCCYCCCWWWDVVWVTCKVWMWGETVFFWGGGESWGLKREERGESSWGWKWCGEVGYWAAILQGWRIVGVYGRDWLIDSSRCGDDGLHLLSYIPARISHVYHLRGRSTPCCVNFQHE